MRATWDRGTILLHDAEAPPSGATWDPRVGVYRAPAAAWSSLMGIQVDEVVPELPRPPALIVPALRPYQEAAVLAWELAGRRGTVILPTGAGKTRTAVAALARAGLRALVLAPTRVLLDPWIAALRAAGADEVGRYGDGARVERPITVATMASARLHAETLGNRFDALVVDEVHHFGGGALDETLDMFTAPFRLGLTATPHDDPVRAARLDALVGPIVYEASLDELAGKWLAPFRTVTLTVDLTRAERAAHDAEARVWRPYVRAFFEATPGAGWANLVANAQKTDAGRRALAAWRRSRAILALPERKRALLGELLLHHAASRALVFCGDATSAIELARQLLVPALTAEIGRDERARVLAAFASGELRVIASARVLNEGVDVPDADVAVIVGGSQGQREYVQRVGRVLRPVAGKEAVVYNVVTRGTREVERASERARG